MRARAPSCCRCLAPRRRCCLIVLPTYPANRLGANDHLPFESHTARNARPFPKRCSASTSPRATASARVVTFAKAPAREVTVARVIVASLTQPTPNPLPERRNKGARKTSIVCVFDVVRCLPLWSHQVAAPGASPWEDLLPPTPNARCWLPARAARTLRGYDALPGNVTRPSVRVDFLCGLTESHFCAARWTRSTNRKGVVHE